MRKVEKFPNTFGVKISKEGRTNFNNNNNNNNNKELAIYVMGCYNATMYVILYYAVVNDLILKTYEKVYVHSLTWWSLFGQYSDVFSR